MIDMGQMRREDYSADAICRAMDLPGFIEPSWTQSDYPTLRVVLTPSFDPELCITISPKVQVALISVVALSEQLWSYTSQVRLPFWREEMSVSREVLGQLIELFGFAAAAKESHAIVDGMGSESCLVSKAGTKRFAMHTWERPMTRLVARLVEITWSAFRDPKVRNALARAGGYLNIKYPLLEIPLEPPVTRIAVLGTPEMRQDYFEMLSAAKKNGPE